MEGVLQKLNRPKTLVVVVVVAFVIDGLLFYRYQHSITKALTSGPSAVATAAPTSFTAPTEQKGSSPTEQKGSSSTKKTDGAKKGILATALDALGLDGSSETAQTPYVPLSRLSASSPPETRD